MLSEVAKQHKRDYNKQYRKDNKDKVNAYSTKYKKEKYVRKLIQMKPEEFEKLDKILKQKGLNLREYVMEKVEQDILL